MNDDLIRMSFFSSEADTAVALCVEGYFTLNRHHVTSLRHELEFKKKKNRTLRIWVARDNKVGVKL